MKNEVIRSITANGIVAALYFLLTFITAPFSYMGVQVRIAEVLILLCFFRRDYVIGTTLGCILANLLSPLGAWDVLFGSLATLVSGLLISFTRQLFIATLWPVITNAFVVGAELYFLLELPFWTNVGLVALGEFIAVSCIGYALFLIIGKKEHIQRLIGAKRCFNFKW
ncbi:MAG: QueT transporter family protein [Bacilli bacterium]|nr:QueT transporter family protein [Bacilli bacterium]